MDIDKIFDEAIKQTVQSFIPSDNSNDFDFEKNAEEIERFKIILNFSKTLLANYHLSLMKELDLNK